MEAPMAHGSFLEILREHDASDVIIACRRRHDLGDPETFHCHRAVLERRCALFADEAESTMQRQPRIFFNADDDIVFEVLRFVYCGSISFSSDFLRRFDQFLGIVDYLGIEEMAERMGSLQASIFSEPGLVRWLQSRPSEDILELIQMEGIIGSTANGSRAVGFSLRRGFFTKLLELRPEVFNIERLGEELHRRIKYFGSPVPSPRGGNPVPCHLFLPAPVVYAHLGKPNRAHTINLSGPANLLDKADWGEEQQGRLWHGGRPLDPDVSRQSLLNTCGSEDLVIFQETARGQTAFDATMQRVETLGSQQARFQAALNGLVSDHGDLVWILDDRSATTFSYPPDGWSDTVVAALPWNNVERSEMGHLHRYKCYLGDAMSSVPDVALGSSGEVQASVVGTGSLTESANTPCEVLVLGCPEQVEECCHWMHQPEMGRYLFEEMRQAMDAAGRTIVMPDSFVVAALRCGPRTVAPAALGSPLGSFNPTRPIDSGWLGGFVLGESVMQILFRWALHTQANGERPPWV